MAVFTIKLKGSNQSSTIVFGGRTISKPDLFLCFTVAAQVAMA